MAPESWASSPSVRVNMQANRRRDTTPELNLRRALHRLGLRYRVDKRPLPDLNRRADIVFGTSRVAVVVHGCFWHGCPQHFSLPATNADYWRAKIETNTARDRDTAERLGQAGWTVVTVWEHEDATEAARRIYPIVQSRREARQVATAKGKSRQRARVRRERRDDRGLPSTVAAKGDRGSE